MLKLPHPELAGMVEAIKREVVGTRVAFMAGTEVPYWVFRSSEVTPELALYDEDGTIYVSEAVVKADTRSADLCAYHKHIEIRHKRAGRSHACAHRRAYIAELLAAKNLFGGPDELLGYLRWRIGLYPAWKELDSEMVAMQLHSVLSETKLRKGEVLQMIKDHRL